MKISEEKKPIVMIVAIIVIVISVFSMMRTAGGPKAKIDMDRFESLGRFAAEETANFLGGPKDVVVIAMTTDPAPALKKQQEAFLDALKDAKINVVAVEVVSAGPDEMPIMAMEMGMLSMEDYADIVQRHSGVDALVSLVGLPMSRPDSMVSLPDQMPPLIVAQSMGMMMGVRELMDSGAVTMAIMPRMDVGPETEDKPQTHREWFDRYFQVVTADNAAEIPY